MFEAGKVLSERYKLLRPLGQGSQAHVWVAEHLALGSQVAVKLIDPDLAKQKDARDRFAIEAAAAAKLRSAHVVQILDHGIDAEQPYIVMELLEGEDLFDRLARRGRLTLAETSRIVTQVARALGRAHTEGIVHRDMKPENVFIVRNEDDEIAKVLDFGVAKVVTPQKDMMTRTGVGTLIGTPHYMSPEQVKGLAAIDHRSDLWSLGVIAYQCLTGRLPFDSEGVGDLLIRISMNEPEPPSKFNSELGPDLDEWFARACSKDVSKRFQSARELAESLAQVVRGSAAVHSQRGRMLVALSDANDMDWGSLAGVPVPGRDSLTTDRSSSPQRPSDPNRPSDPSRPSDPNRPSDPSRPSDPVVPPMGVVARFDEQLLLGTPPVEAPVASSRLPPAPPRPKVPTDLATAPPIAVPLALSARIAEPDVRVDLEQQDDESVRTKRAGRFVLGAAVLGALGLAFGVVQSRGGLDGLLESPASPSPRTTVAAPESMSPTPSVAAPSASAVSSASAISSASPSDSAAAVIDPARTKKAASPALAPTPQSGSYPGQAGAAPGSGAGRLPPRGAMSPASNNGEIIIVVPDPPPE